MYIQHLYWISIKRLKFNMSKWNSLYFLYSKHVLLPFFIILINGNFIFLVCQVENVGVIFDLRYHIW